MMDVSERYQRDPLFHAMVNLLRGELAKGEFTPTELREAVILAATMHDAENVRPIMLTLDQYRAWSKDRL